ncbi:MAG: hypothetical protein DDT26_00282 [Dehalococcoidia bacterium]|nr:hypothetical protein [Chloroflexota bacterium]
MAKASGREELAFVYDGVPVTTLAEIFDLDPKEVNRRIVGRVNPVTSPSGARLKYRIREAAPFLVEQKIDIEEYIKALTPAKLPPALTDAFWKAMLSRQKFEENNGELWRTNRVLEVVSSAFKAVRLTIIMFGDTVSQQSELSDKQREVIQDLTDGLLSNLHRALVDEFEMYVPADDEHGTPPGAGGVLLEDDDA